MATDFASTFLACGGIFLLAFFDLGILVCRAVARSKRSSVGKVRLSYIRSRLTGLDLCRLRMRPKEKAADCSAAFFIGSFIKFLVAVGPDSDAHAGSAEADTATVLIAAALDITLARSISVSIAPVADDNTAFTAFAPATAVFIADHPNVLNVALRCD